jgi:Glyoxalase-like domain
VSPVTTLRSHIDHIVVTAPSLESGVEYVRDALGVTPQAGGEHLRMGTHNCLLKLGNALYLEVISINPAAADPDRARWFQLDREPANLAPRLATWICRTNDISAAVAAAAHPLGNIEAMSRGKLNWQITIPADGSLPFDGVAPMLIEWRVENHPAASLRDLGCSLVGLEAFHAEAHEISRLLQSIGFQAQFTVCPILPKESPCLVAHIQTPAGIRQLRGQ